MYYVYILSDANSKIYIGYSSNLRKRIQEHQSGEVTTTKKMKNPRLIYYEAYNSKALATSREKKLKHYGSSYTGLLKRIRIK
jgi:putative endonuclease